jgi:hypothetical protein
VLPVVRLVASYVELKVLLFDDTVLELLAREELRIDYRRLVSSPLMC